MSTIFQMWFGCFFYNLLKFDVFNADVPFGKRGHDLEKLNKAQHHFSNEVSLNVPANFQLEFHQKMHVNELKMFTLTVLYAVLLRKRLKTFHEISTISM